MLCNALNILLQESNSTFFALFYDIMYCEGITIGI